MTSSLEKTFEHACREREIAGAVLLAADKTGKFEYAKTFGVRSLKPESAAPLAMDDMMWIASCTKLMTAIAVMQCVERGLLDLDQDATIILPELKPKEIVTGFDESGQPTYQKRTEKMTLRMMLTHSAGISYDAFDPMLQQWRNSQGQKINHGPTISERYGYPLRYEPGTSWMYSPGTDWAGLAVEKVNDNISLHDFMQKNIWQPLGIKDMMFDLIGRDNSLLKRQTDMSMRDPSGSGKAIYIESPNFANDCEDAMGGGGVYATPLEYFKILKALLANDGKLMKKESMDELFRPCLTDASQQALTKLLEDPILNNQLGGTPLGTIKDWSIGGMIIKQELPSWSRKGTMTWGGLPNLAWFIDRDAGLCGLYASQIIPPGDAKSVDMIRIFQKAMYQQQEGATARI